MNNVHTVEICEFITHVAKTDNKKAPNKYIKINNQLIYNSNLNRFARNIVVKNLHEYLIPLIQDSLSELTNYPYQVSLDIHVPINYGDVSRRTRKHIPYICWKKPVENYVAGWDIGNLGELWLKVFEDALQMAGIIENDSVQFINSHGPITFYECDDLSERKLVFKITEIN
jgi:hypothetical protein